MNKFIQKIKQIPTWSIVIISIIITLITWYIPVVNDIVYTFLSVGFMVALIKTIFSKHTTEDLLVNPWRGWVYVI